MNFIIHVNAIITNEQNKLLLVKEKKEKHLNKLNLPGGHLKLGEKIIDGAKREVLEEVNAEAELTGLIGIFTGKGDNHFINFIFAGKLKGGPKPNKNEINDLDWYSIEKILSEPEENILNPRKLKEAVKIYQSGKLNSLDIIQEEIYPI